MKLLLFNSEICRLSSLVLNLLLRFFVLSMFTMVAADFLTVFLLDVLSLSLPNRYASPFSLGFTVFFLSSLIPLYFFKIFSKFFGCAAEIIAMQYIKLLINYFWFAELNFVFNISSTLFGRKLSFTAIAQDTSKYIFSKMPRSNIHWLQSFCILFVCFRILFTIFFFFLRINYTITFLSSRNQPFKIVIVHEGLLRELISILRLIKL